MLVFRERGRKEYKQTAGNQNDSRLYWKLEDNGAVLSEFWEKIIFHLDFYIQTMMKCEISVSLKYVLLMWSSAGNYLLEYVSHQNKVIIQERRRHGSQETERCRIYQEEGEGNFQGGSHPVGLESILYRFEEEDIEFQEGFCQEKNKHKANPQFFFF